MALIIKVPESAWHTQDIVLNGVTFNMVLKFNTRDASWYVDLLDANQQVILYGLKVMPNQSLTGRFSYLTTIPDGNLWCLRRKRDFSPIGRDNLGVDNTYELIWLSSEEERELGYNGRIQL